MDPEQVVQAPHQQAGQAEPNAQLQQQPELNQEQQFMPAAVADAPASHKQPFEKSLLSQSIFQMISVYIYIFLAIDTSDLSLIIAAGFIYTITVVLKYFAWKAISQIPPIVIRINPFSIFRFILLLDFPEAIKADKHPNRQSMRFIRVMYTMSSLIIYSYSYSSFTEFMSSDQSLLSSITYPGSSFQTPFYINLFQSLGGAFGSIAITEFFKNETPRKETLRQRFFSFVYVFAQSFTVSLLYITLKNIWYLFGSSYILIRMGINYLISQWIFSSNPSIRAVFPQIPLNAKKNLFTFLMAFFTALGATYDVSPIYRRSHPQYDRIVKHYSVVTLRFIIIFQDILVLQFVYSSINAQFKLNTDLYHITLIIILIQLAFSLLYTTLFILNLFFPRSHTIDISLITQMHGQNNMSTLNQQLQQQQPHLPSINSSDDIESGIRMNLIDRRNEVAEEEDIESQFESLIGSGHYKSIKSNFMLEQVLFTTPPTFPLANPAIKNTIFKILSLTPRQKFLRKSTVLINGMANAITTNVPKNGFLFLFTAESSNHLIEFFETQAPMDIPANLKIKIVLRVSLDTRQRFALLKALLNAVPISQIEFSAYPVAKVTCDQLKAFFSIIQPDLQAIINASYLFQHRISPYLTINPRQVLYDLHEPI